MGRKLFVEVCNAADLMPKDGQGSASAYCTMEFDGQRRKTETKAKDLNPVWNSVAEFPVFEGKPFEDEVLEVCVLCEKKGGVQKKPGFLGRVRIPGRSIVKKGEEALVYYPLERRSIFSHVKGEIGLKVWWTDEPDPPPPPQPAEGATPAEGETKEAAPPPAPEGAPASEAAAPASEAAPPAEDPSPPAAAENPPAADPPKEEENKTEEKQEEPKEEKKEEPEPVKEEPKQQEAPKEEEKKEEAKEEQPKEEPKEEPKPEPKPEPKEEKQNEEPKEEQKKDDKEKKKKEEKVEEYRSVEKKRDKEDQRKDEFKRERKRPTEVPTIVIKRDEEIPQIPRKRTVPSTDFVLKETKPALSRGIGEKVVTYDLVEKMNYLFVKVVKARALMEQCSGSSYARIVFGSLTAKTREVGRSLYPEWHEVFAFCKDNSGGPVVEVSIWDNENDQFMGAVAFDLQEIPFRVPPDSPLAPQWYRLENISKNAGNKVRGDVMLAIWWGTQADEAFTEAWQSDSGGYAHTRGKVYLSPKLWYLRVNVIEAQEVQPTDKTRFPEVSVRAQLGFQVHKTKVAANKNTSPLWNEDLLFVAAEPFEDDLLLVVQNKTAKPGEEEVLGMVKIALSGIERRVDHRLVQSCWFNLERYNPGGEKHFHGRLHLRLCFDGGYHVMDESTHYSSCVRPTAKQLWRPVVGVLELGIIRGKDIHPMKTIDGRGATDAYCVAKYGQKWVRTRTVVDNLNPRWNEQYSWEVYDPCTVLTVGMFDNCHVHPLPEGKDLNDLQIGKVRIRISTLESERIYTNSHPLLMLQKSGVRKLGEIELAVRYSSISIVNVMSLYFKPLLPKMHYLHPLGVTQSEILRISAMRLVAIRLNRSEPPLRKEVVQYMLDADFHVWSLRRSKVNYFRIMNLLAGPMAVATWFNNICHWKNPVTTMLVHVLFLILVMYPELILPTLFLYLALIGAWHYRYRPRSPPSMDGKLSQAEHVEPDELDEEFDPIPTNKDLNVVKARYDRLRIVSSRIQNVLGDIATQGERLSALLSWRDPRASGIMVAVCMTIALILYVVPLRVVLIIVGLYVLRHPRFRDPLPGSPLNFFRRLPSLADRIL